jgi:hypothetical protein
MQLVHPHGGEAVPLVPSFAVDFLASCRRFAPIEEHLRRYAAFHESDELEMQSLQAWVVPAIEAGLMISERQLIEQCRAGAGEELPPPPLTMIGFPTGNRPELIRRALESFAENARSHGRDIEFVLADNSHDPAPNREIARETQRRFGSRVTFFGASEKKALAAELVSATGCDPEVLEFALFDPEECRFLCGANRNALLLHAAGRMCSSVDDDMVCRIAEPPGGAGAALRFYAHRDVFERWFYPDQQSALDAADFVERDYAAVHEELLGRSIADLISARKDVGFGKISDELLRRLSRGAGRVVMTFTGHVGDPGIPTSYYHLGYRRESLRRLTANEKEYRTALRSRSVRAMVMHPCIDDASISPGLAMGLDARELLPPFIPVLHAEDYAYGATVWRCLPRGFLAHLPAALPHLPPGQKSIVAPGDLGSLNRVAIWEFSHILRQIVLVHQPAASVKSPEACMIGLGRYLRELGEAVPADFDDHIRRIVVRHASEKIEYFEYLLRKEPDAPQFWRADVEEYLEHTRHAFADEGFEVPYDLRTRGSAEEARRLMQRLVRRFGGLLEAWPALFSAAKERACRGQTSST